ncbi:hypothetical protein ABT095_33125 [Kitasatospora sp. NPDC002227]|uniref:hypothetical protein n=1 Tax=Kitasatospora sp. NPDC002227 TaxID=3154773 RepID=UPI003329C8C3
MTHLLTFLTVLVVVALVTSRRSKAAKRAAGSGSGRAPVSFDAAAYGLPPRDALDPHRAGPSAAPHVIRASQELAETVWGGDWAAAAAHLKAAGTDWDEHAERYDLLRAVARKQDDWLTAWRAADPGSCDAATLEADLMVHRAWEIRGNKYAHEVPAENMAKFQALLPAAIEAAERAALLDEHNPAPWVVMVTAARGARYTPDRFKPLWDGLVARAPHHFEGHWQGMEYRCAKWFGSDVQMMRFVEQAMDNAPKDSLLPGLYLYALAELDKRGSALPSHAVLRQRLTTAAEALAGAPADRSHVSSLRHLLAFYLGRAKMYEAALEQFRLIGPYCGSSVWSDQGDPVEAFHAARAEAVLQSGAEPVPAGPMRR